ncbi:hypothetical protein [Aeromicrobium sp.]|uniref:hypothetical protein n=1 Tax=Aeromicrobium sp. TaxID=1871063 RepID=UPI0019888206|nr:hypothetical protein [Aeromicrobium sp.]MBC7632931.1 hypothetical protein [Aeromicrobium sp.]
MTSQANRGERLVGGAASARGVTAAGVALAVVLAWALLPTSVTSPAGVQVTVVAVALTSAGLIGAVGMSQELGLRTALARLKLGPWMGVGFAVGFGLATLVWLAGDIEGYQGIVTASSLTPSALVCGVGFATLALAYRWTPQVLRRCGSSFDRRLRGNGPLSTGASVVWTLWAIAVLAQLIGAATSGLGYLADPRAELSASSSVGTVLTVFTSLGLLSSLLAAWRLAATRTAGAALLTVWVGGSQVVVGLFGGTKESAVIQFVALVIGYSARGKLRVIPIVATGLITMFFVAPFVTAYRAEIATSSGRLTPAQALQSIDYGSLLDNGKTSGSQAPGNQFIQRLSRIGDVAMVVAQSPTPVPFASPTDLLAGPVLGFIPRSLWPEKPVLDAGYQANIVYYHAPPSVYSSAALTPYGDLYRHGGVMVVIVGMLLLGFFVRVIDDRTGGRSASVDPRMLFLPMLFFTTLVKQETDYLSLAASIVSIVAAAAIGVRLTSSGSLTSQEVGARGRP